MGDFFSMGGYGDYVWPAYIISALVLIGLITFVLRRAAKARRELAALEEKRGDKD